MAILVTTLVTDGSSDRALIPMIEFLLDEHSTIPYQAPQHAINTSRANDLSSRIAGALQAFPCDLLIVHRDAETATYEDRRQEVFAAAAAHVGQQTICVVPVRMTEAWLLLDEEAIRRASGNPNGRHPLSLPTTSKVERLPDPKLILREALVEASNLPRRRQPDFNVARQRVSELMRHELLRGLTSFRQFEEDIASYFGPR